MGPLSLENFRNNLSASWRVVGSKTSNATHQVRITDVHLLESLISHERHSCCTAADFNVF